MRTAIVRFTEKFKVNKAAKTCLGMSWSQYVAAHGQSRGAAEAVLVSAGIDPLSVLEGL